MVSILFETQHIYIADIMILAQTPSPLDRSPPDSPPRGPFIISVSVIAPSPLDEH